MIDPRQSGFMNSAKVQIWCFESPFVVVFTGLTVFSRVLGFFSVDFIEARTERKKTIVKDENSIY